MIVKVFNKESEEPEKYSFTDELVHLGRNPSTEASVLIDSQTISRNHLKARLHKQNIQIMDLSSSNGTFIGQRQLQPNVWVSVDSNDKITVAQFEGYVTFEVRQQTIKKSLEPLKKTLLNKKSPSSDSQSQRSRSREKEKTARELPFKISQSTLKMLKDMTINKKTKEERVKFLKLMGIGKAEEYWPQIEGLLKSKKGIKDSKKTSEELEKQFSLARSGMEKRGLGK